MKASRIFLADTNPAFLADMERLISRCDDLKIIGTATDGLTALDVVRDVRPDIVLMELLLPGLDGLCLLKAMSRMRPRPVIILLSAFYSDSTVVTVRKNGANYFLYKPAEPEAVLTVIREHAALLRLSEGHEQLRRHVEEGSESFRNVRSIMRCMGFSPKYSGSGYLAESVILACESPLMIRNLSSELYQELACKMHTSPSRIERSMRTAIAAANANGRLEAIIGQTPTNKRCIQYILNEIKSKGITG